MISRFRGAVSAGAGCCPAVLGIGNRSPVAGSQVVICILIAAVRTARTLHGTAMLGAVVGSPASVGQRMVGIFIGTVPASGTGHCSAVLSGIVAAP